MCVCPKGVCISIVCVTLYGTQTYLLHCKSTQRNKSFCIHVRLSEKVRTCLSFVLQLQGTAHSHAHTPIVR